MPVLPAVSVAPWAPVARPSPPASTPISSTVLVVVEGLEGADRVRARADAGDHARRQPAGHVADLAARLVADHALQVAHHRRKRRRADDRTDDVVGVLDGLDPVADRGGDRLLQGLAIRP